MDTDDIFWLASQLRIADDRERRHVERIHILITTAIIASYFTPTAQNLISSEGISQYTDLLVSISVIYLSIRLIDTTIPVRDLHSTLDWLFGFIAPLGFLMTVLGYLTAVFFTIYSIPATDTLVSVISTIIAIISLLLSFYRAQYDLSSKKESSTSFREKVIQFEDYIYKNPEEVEEGLTWNERESDISSTRVDFAGTDQQGNIVYGEAKMGRIDRNRISSVLLRIAEDVNEGRLLIITDSKPRSSAKAAINSLEKNFSNDVSIEIKTIEYDSKLTQSA